MTKNAKARKESEFLERFLNRIKIRQSLIDWMLVHWLYRNSFPIEDILIEATKYPLKEEVMI